MSDILSTQDIEKLVNTFYDNIRKDELLAPIFDMRISAEKWPVHLEKMYRFWGSILLQTQNYNGSPFDKHIGLPIDGTHFKQWIDIFYKTIDELFEGEVAATAKERAANIARIFEFKLSTLK
ncbi:MAG: group III truncated hemoglobin [Bacteroidia bacterium]|nr:group III truncated hemoglobin [Bacteroidia bacterium]